MPNATDDGAGDAPIKHLLTIREAATFIGLSESTLRRLIHHNANFPVQRVSPGKVMIPRGRLLDWLGYVGVEPAATDRRRGLYAVRPTMKGD